MNGTLNIMTMPMVPVYSIRRSRRRLLELPATSSLVVTLSSILLLSCVLFSSVHATAASSSTIEHRHHHHPQDTKTAKHNGEIDIAAASVDSNNSSSSSRNSSLNLMILSEPSPVTYMSGQSARFGSLLEYLSRHKNTTGDTTILVTSSTTHYPHDDEDDDHDRGGGVPQKVLLPKSCYDDTIPIEYTWGFRLPQYPALTLGVDIRHKIWRLCRRGVEVDTTTTTTNIDDTVCDVQEESTRQQQQQQRRKFDLIHVSTPGLLVFPAIVSSRMHGIPLVMSYHTHLPSYIPIYFEQWPKIFQKFLTWFSWRLIIGAHKMFGHMTVVTSSQIADDFYNHGYTDNESLVVWPKGVNTTQFHPRYKDETMRRRMLGLTANAAANEVDNVNSSNGRGSTSDTHGSNTLLLVYIGRLGKEKRLKDLKPILEQLQKRIDEASSSSSSSGDGRGRRGPDSVHLCIVGSGPHEEELHQYFKGTNTTFLGSLEGLPLSQAYASADIFVMPSDTETLGFVVMEAMASSTPVVGCAAGGLLDLVQDKSTGLLVPTGDVNGYVEKIWMLSQDEKLYHRLAYNGLQASKHWSWESSMEFMRRKVYPDVIRRFRQNNGWWPVRAFGRGRQKEV